MFPHICVVKMISATWESFRAMYVGVGPPPPRHGRKGSPSPNSPPGTATKEGKGGVGQMGFRAIPPPAKQFSSRQRERERERERGAFRPSASYLEYLPFGVMALNLCGLLEKNQLCLWPSCV